MTNLDTTNWLPARSMTGGTNPAGISGIYYALDTNLTSIQAEVENLGTWVPSTMLLPVMSSRGIVMGDETDMKVIASEDIATGGSVEFSGIVSFVGWRQRGTVSVFSYNLSSLLFQGYLMHEWGHSLDNQFQYELGSASALFSDNNTAFQAAWTRAQTFWSAAPDGQATFYGWRNDREFFAELFRYHWCGAEYGGNLGGTNFTGGWGGFTADQNFRGLVSGFAAATGSDDSFVTAMHVLIGALAPPYGPARY